MELSDYHSQTDCRVFQSQIGIIDVRYDLRLTIAIDFWSENEIFSNFAVWHNDIDGIETHIENRSVGSWRWGRSVIANNEIAAVDDHIV